MQNILEISTEVQHYALSPEQGKQCTVYEQQWGCKQYSKYPYHQEQGVGEHTVIPNRQFSTCISFSFHRSSSLSGNRIPYTM